MDSNQKYISLRRLKYWWDSIAHPTVTSAINAAKATFSYNATTETLTITSGTSQN